MGSITSKQYTNSFESCVFSHTVCIHTDINNCSLDVTLALGELSVAKQVPEMESDADGSSARRILQSCMRRKGGGAETPSPWV